MKNPIAPTVPAISAETLALYSLSFGCNSADGGLKNFMLGPNAAQRMRFLHEQILFHHFMAIVVSSIVLPNLESRNAYCGKMVEAIGSASRLLSSRELDLPPLKHYSATDQEDAIRICLLNPPNILAVLGQELYIERNPSESELKVMNLQTVRDTTGWDSPTANPTQYFAAALLARLADTLEIDFHEHARDFIDLSIYAVSEALSAFESYVDLLGAKIATKSGGDQPRRTPRERGNWLSNLFKRTSHSSAARGEGLGSPAPRQVPESGWVKAQSRDRQPEPAQAPVPRGAEIVSDDIPAEMIEKGLYFRRNHFSSISNWEDRMFSEFGERVVPLLRQIWNRTS